MVTIVDPSVEDTVVVIDESVDVDESVIGDVVCSEVVVVSDPDMKVVSNSVVPASPSLVEDVVKPSVEDDTGSPPLVDETTPSVEDDTCVEEVAAVVVELLIPALQSL